MPQSRTSFWLSMAFYKRMPSTVDTVPMCRSRSDNNCEIYRNWSSCVFRRFIFHFVRWSLIDGDDEKHAISLHYYIWSNKYTFVRNVNWNWVFLACALRLFKESLGQIQITTKVPYAMSSSFFVWAFLSFVLNAGHAIDRLQPINELNARSESNVWARVPQQRDRLSIDQIWIHTFGVRARARFIHVCGEKFSADLFTLCIRCLYSMSDDVCRPHDSDATRRYVRITLGEYFGFFFCFRWLAIDTHAQHF